MANSTIWENLLAIQTAIYGREIRGAIHDSIEECYNNVVAGETLADTAAASATSAAGDAISAKQQALSAATTANNAANAAAQATTNANNAATYAANATTNANAARDAANTAAGVASNSINYFCGVYSTSGTYEVGDYCIQDNKLWRCLTAIPSGEAWTPSHWLETTVGHELKLNTPGTMTTDDIAESATKKYLPYVSGNSRYELASPLYTSELRCDMGTLGNDQSIGTKIADLSSGKEVKGSVTIDNTSYTLRTGTTGAAGYITFVLEE